MIILDTWYIFNKVEDKRLFLEYAKSNLNAEYDDEIDYMEKDVLRVTYQREIDDEFYTINYRTHYDPHYINAKTFTNEDAEDILKRLRGSINMEVNQEPKTTIRDIMEREFRKERTKLEKRCDELINDAYASCPMGEQAKLLANLIMANTTLEIDFKTYLTEDILPLNIRREIIAIRAELETEMAKLSDKYQNLEAMLSICDTYEQKEKLLKKTIL